MLTYNSLKLLIYFDVFEHPLSGEEIALFTGTRAKNYVALQDALAKLCQSGIINFKDGFYYLGNNDTKVENRILANNLAAKRLKTAHKFSRIISWFPFVRGIFLSGSISKGVMKKNDDIDYFIVTEPGRLWIARTLLILFKKIFLLNSYKNFCINYFVDTLNLVIKEQNQYTATEIVFLLPVYNYPLYLQVLEANPWVKQYYPDFIQPNQFVIQSDPLVKRWIEKLIHYFGEGLDVLLFERSKRFILGKYARKNEDDFKRSFTITRDELRFLPNHQQFNILERFREKVSGIKKSNIAADLFLDLEKLVV